MTRTPDPERVPTRRLSPWPAWVVVLIVIVLPGWPVRDKLLLLGPLAPVLLAGWYPRPA